MPSYRYAYLHGFASSPRSTKASELHEAFLAAGETLHVPDLNRPSFARLSHAAMLEVVDELYAAEPGPPRPLRLVGSSLGGYLAARYAELHPDRVDRLVLLCPAFRLVDRWPHLLGEEWFALWEKEGWLAIPDATGQPVRVHWGFIEESRRLPREPSVSCPTLVVHGRDDASVPIQLSREYVARHPNAHLVEVDDDHALARSIDRITADVQRFFELGRPTT